MDISTLLSDPSVIRLECFISEPESITIVVRSIQQKPHCPKCNIPSASLHSNYQRTIADLPWHGVAIKLNLHVRKFRCKNGLCKQKVFCERLPKVADAYARKTVRLNDTLILLAFALGGEAGARVAKKLSMTTSGDTLLRRIRRVASQCLPTPSSLPKTIGVDDWAWRKGHTYGTIIVDLEQRKVIDLLPDREAETLTAWLRSHKSVETVARDRSKIYKNGIVMGLPFAKQVADRWHLLKNLSDALRSIVDRLQKRRKRSVRAQQPSTETNISNEFESVSRNGVVFESISDKEWEKSVQKTFEEVKKRLCRNRLEPHLPAIAIAPSKSITTNLKSYSNNASGPHCYERDEFKKLDSDVLVRLCFHKEDLSEENTMLLNSARTLCAEFDKAYLLSRAFISLVRGKKEMTLNQWIAKAWGSGIKELTSFANGLQSDYMAVQESFTSKWSNGQTEGQVNRLKLIKRQMYGRAKFDLLRARVLNKA